MPTRKPAAEVLTTPRQERLKSVTGEKFSQHVTKEPVTLVGFQAVFEPSKFGHTLSTVLPDSMIADLEEEREDRLDYIRAKLKNPRRSTLKPEPWVETDEGDWAVKFTWKPEEADNLPIIDSEGTLITDRLPLYEGSKVKLAYIQKAYILKDGITYGTTLKLKAIQVIEVCSGAGVDRGDLDEEAAASLFGTSKGFKAGDPNVRPLAPKKDEADDDEADTTDDPAEY